MINIRFLQCTITVLCLAVLTSCNGKSSSVAESEPTTSQITTVSTTATTTETTTITITSTEESEEVTTAVSTTVVTDTTKIRTKMLDRIADSMDEPTELTSPFGDISNAYVCFGGTVVYPDVHILSADEVKKLSKVLNSMEWTEFPEKPATPPTSGPSDLTLYVNDNGKRSQLSLLSDTYCDENGYRYFLAKSPADIEESFSIYEIVNDLLFNGDSKNVSTHLYMQTEIFKTAEDYDVNKYWDLIWDDVMLFINNGENQYDYNQ